MVKTLIEAIGLVIVVMFVFLQNWRATLIPAIAVPVVLLGTFGVLAAFGYSINTLTMFAMVLAIGLLVDDAIVVVENVERIMEEEGLSPKEATIKSMDEITGALVGIALVLSAVFLPMAFFGGSTGVIYRQFSVTIVSAMVLSVLVALILTPALCATLLKPTKAGSRATGSSPFGWFNRNFERMVTRYTTILGGLIHRPWPMLAFYGVLVAGMALLFFHLPSSSCREEDQGVMIALFNLPTGATQPRTVEVGNQIRNYFFSHEKDNVEGVYTVAGFNFAGAGQNLGQAFVHLRNWKDRPGARNHAPAIAQRAMGAFSKIRDAQVFVLVPPAVQELGNSSGFDLELEDRAGLGHEKLLAARNQLLGMAAQDPLLAAVRPNGQEDTPQLHLDIDHERAGALGLSQADVANTLSAASGGIFVNNFIDRGRVKKVFIQGDAPFRSSPEDLGLWYVRGASGSMAPFSAFSTSSWLMGPSQLQRYNGEPAMEIQGQAAPGKSSGAAMNEMEKLLAKLPPGIGFEWTGLSYQERQSGSQAPALLGLSLLVVFLCLAALYESWSIPISVLLVVPLGVFGAVLAATLRGFYNDVYFQVGLLTTIGLSAKNAILIVQFADEAEAKGESPLDAAMEAARLRLRPILMTSLAFIAGVFPLAISSGAGAGSQNDIGTGVIGGMLAATVMAIFFVPLFFVLVRGAFRGRQPASRRTRLSRRGRPKVRRALPVVLAAAAWLAGCIDLSPTYRRPAEPTPAQFPTGASYPPPTSQPPVIVGWRDFFADPRLKTVIETALANNRDLRIAVANIAEARAQYQVQRAALLPALNAQAGATHRPGTSECPGRQRRPGGRQGQVQPAYLHRRAHGSGLPARSLRQDPQLDQGGPGSIFRQQAGPRRGPDHPGFRGRRRLADLRRRPGVAEDRPATPWPAARSALTSRSIASTPASPPSLTSVRPTSSSSRRALISPA